MIVYKKGDLLKSDCNIICHQVNCQGVMGSGIALQIRNQFPRTYKEYVNFCKDVPKTTLLGKAFIVEEIEDRYVGNLFGQNQFGRGKQQTDYGALENSLGHVIYFANQKNLKTIGIPYKMGCDRGGGDWSVVESILKKLFDNSDLILEIYKLG